MSAARSSSPRAGLRRGYAWESIALHVLRTFEHSHRVYRRASRTPALLSAIRLGVPNCLGGHLKPASRGRDKTGQDRYRQRSAGPVGISSHPLHRVVDAALLLGGAGITELRMKAISVAKRQKAGSTGAAPRRRGRASPSSCCRRSEDRIVESLVIGRARRSVMDCEVGRVSLNDSRVRHRLVRRSARD
jgi:hypothetical protein